jgi:hypothetical protein
MAGAWVCGVEYWVDPPGEIAFYAPADLLFCSSLGLAFLDVVDSGGVEGHPAQGDQVQGFVQGSVTAAVVVST